MKYSVEALKRFLIGSLAIEGIYRPPTQREIEATMSFLDGACTADTVIELQEVYAPGMPLRDQPTMNVAVGNYIAPRGHTGMRRQLATVLVEEGPWSAHVLFEQLHPFMDGNGRTGRAVWAWKMLRKNDDPFALSFLHKWYYQTLQYADAGRN